MKIVLQKSKEFATDSFEKEKENLINEKEAHNLFHPPF